LLVRPRPLLSALLIVAGALLAPGLTATVSHADPLPEIRFKSIASYETSGGGAEIVAATPDGMTLIYTDAGEEEVGVVDISTAAKPKERHTIAMPGEPTSVAVTPNGRWALVTVYKPALLMVIDLSDYSIATRISLGGQPDAVTVSPDGRYAAIAIENERNEEIDLGRMPQTPPGFLTIVDLAGGPANWQTRDVFFTDLAEFSSDPEPEFVDINAANQVAVTLQENNSIAVVSLANGNLVAQFSAGEAKHAADLEEDGQVSFSQHLVARREPDGIAWTPGGLLATANEGDYELDSGEAGGRGFSIFTLSGSVLYDSGASLEEAADARGYYPDDRSGNKGIEAESVEVGSYFGFPFLFVGSERGDFVAVYRIDDESNPQLVQLLKTGAAPEGLLAIPARNLLVSANEDDGTLSIFEASK
jgi:DNA-binding beta-propeller fold protein YncE